MHACCCCSCHGRRRMDRSRWVAIEQLDRSRGDLNICMGAGPAERRDAVASNTTLHYTIAKHGPELIYMMCRFSWRQNAEPSTLFGLVYYECRLLTGLRTFSCLRFRAAVASDEQQQQKKILPSFNSQITWKS